MHYKTSLAALVIALGTASTAYAVDNGKVTFTGSIIDSPCSITADTVDQIVDLGQVSKVVLLNDGKSTPRQFSIDLQDCTLTTADEVTVTMTGAQSAVHPNLLGITGSATGASIAITDGSGSVIELGTPSSPRLIQNGSNTLAFAAYLQGGTTVTEGDFQSVVDFSLAYQ